MGMRLPALANDFVYGVLLCNHMTQPIGEVGRRI